MLLLTYTPRSTGMLASLCGELAYLTRTVDAALDSLVASNAELQSELNKLSELANALHLVYASEVHSERTVYVGEETLGLRALLDGPSPTLSTLDQARVKQYYRKLASHYHPNGSSPHASADKHREVYAAYRACSLETLYLLSAQAGLSVSCGEVTEDVLLGSVRRKIDAFRAHESYHVASQSLTGLVGRVKASMRLIQAIRNARSQLVISLTRIRETS